MSGNITIKLGDEDRSLHGPGKHGYVLKLKSMDNREAVEKELTQHEGHFYLEKGGPSYLNWFIKNDKIGDELLDQLTDKGLIGGWGEDKGMKNYKWSI